MYPALYYSSENIERYKGGNFSVSFYKDDMLPMRPLSVNTHSLIHTYTLVLRGNEPTSPEIRLFSHPTIRY
jgi:hypothetical protein